jgi:hypothetical protein
LVPVLETIAIRAVVNAPAIQPFNTFNSRQLIYQTRREQDLARHRRKAIRARNSEPILGWGYVNCAVHPATLLFVAKQAVHSSRRLISRLPHVAQEYAPTASPEHDRGA